MLEKAAFLCQNKKMPEPFYKLKEEKIVIK